MSTRGLLVIQSGQKYRLARYLASDAYPSSAGKEILEFIASTEEAGQFEKFRLFANRLHVDNAVSDEDIPCSPYILEDILEGRIRGVPDELSFAQDSMFCEWAYVVDLDRDFLECYKGWNDKPLSKSERFYKEDAKGHYSEFARKTYYAVRKVGEVSFEDIMTTSFDDILERWRS